MTRDELFAVYDVKVASPCPVKWESMTGDHRTRFCSQCQLTVHRFEAMSTAEVAALVERSRTERVCAQMFIRVDGSVMTNDCPSTWKLARREVEERGRTNWWLALTVVAVPLAVMLCAVWAFSDNIKALFGTSTDGMVGDMTVEKRTAGRIRVRTKPLPRDFAKVQAK